MVPIAVLPAGGLMLGLGYALDPTGWGANSALATILVYGGKGIMDNQAWLFAVGVAYGLAKDNNGAAALSGLLGLLIVEMIVGNVAVISQITGVPVDQMGASELIASKAAVSAFTGIMMGIVAATLYNRFHTIKLPAVLGFFGVSVSFYHHLNCCDQHQLSDGLRLACCLWCVGRLWHLNFRNGGNRRWSIRFL